MLVLDVTYNKLRKKNTTLSEQFTNLIQKNISRGTYMHGCTLSFVGTCTSIKTVQLDYFYGPKSKINVLTNETDFFLIMYICMVTMVILVILKSTSNTTRLRAVHPSNLAIKTMRVSPAIV